MIDSLEAQEFDALEEQLLSSGVTFSEMTRHYAQYLLYLISEGALGEISGAKLESITPYLKEAACRERLETDDEYRRKRAVELWGFERKYHKLDKNFSSLIRCVLFCFETEDRWNEEGTGDATPIFLYFLMLKKILPTVCQGFVSFFEELCNE
ncbi:hypothetical protein [Pseudomonas frederiksbergensis]|uniref:hypothetical protein n=1 Tax=Pseudomonas frederiksbergensis TaxID=104087 RepID=UPI003D221FC8